MQAGTLDHKQGSEGGSMPDHPMDPFIRILGESINHHVSVGQVVPWRIVTHVVAPRGITDPLYRHVAIFSRDGREVFVAPPLEIPPRQADLTRFDNQHQRMDWTYEPVIDAEALEPGCYTVRAQVTSRSGKTIAEAELPIRIGRQPKLLHRIKLCWEIPQNDPNRPYLGGVVRTGDVDGDGHVEIVHAVGAKHICVYRLSGEVVWRYDDPQGALIYNTAPFRVFDIDGDGKAEIIAARGSFGELRLVVLDGCTGRVKQQAPFPLLKEIQQRSAPYIEKLNADPADAAAWEGLSKTGHAVRFLSGGEARTSTGIYGAKILVANITGKGKQDLLVQVGEQNCTTRVAMDNQLNVLWQHYIDDGYGGHNPALYDVDGDGKEEVAVGTRLLDHDGRIIWKKAFDQFAAPWEDDHIDQAEAGPFGPNGEMVVVYSCRVCVEAATGKTLWIDPTWHGQEVHAAKMLGDDKYQFVFQDREYRHSKHLCHGNWFDARDAAGARLWNYRHAALHMHRMLDWDGDGRYEVTFGLDLQRRPVRPNLGVFDGHGRLVCVLPRYGFGADVDNDGYDELISWTQWPDVADTIEIFGVAHGPEPGRARQLCRNEFAYNEPD